MACNISTYRQEDENARIAAVWVIIVIVIYLIFRGMVFGGANEVAIRAVEAFGFSSVAVTQRAWFGVSMRGCAFGDGVRYTTYATNPAGKRVMLYVCSGAVWKDSTIRVP